MDELLVRAQISQKSLTTWIYRRTVRVMPAPDVPSIHPDAMEAYVEISGVDVGKKMLLNGQAYLAEGVHARETEYRGYAEEAKTAAIGLWR